MTALATGPMTPAELGLTSTEAKSRVDEVGPNELVREEGPSPIRILLRQFQGVMTWLLLAACAVSLVLGERGDAIAIAVIVVLNALIGFFQEYRAERAVQALRAMSAPKARVLRDGGIAEVPAREVVPGDVLVLEAGDLVAADAQLLEAHALSTNEAALTGESVPVEKRVGADAPGAHLAERHGSVFMGTAVADGTARALVVATGMKTELGHIAHLLTTAASDGTPLQKRLEKVGRSLLVICLGIVAIVATIGLMRGERVVDVLLSAVSLAVAAVPEGLAAIVTVALALGVQRMAARNVLVRKLPAVETLGSATVICTDKTGTLTTGVMSVREVWGQDAAQILDAAAANCEADLKTGVGDSTELALLRAAFESGIDRQAIERDRPRVVVHPFDAVRKRMSIFRADGKLYVKGAVDLLLPLCVGGSEGALAANDRMAARGLRVLAIATGKSRDERDLTLLGLVGIADPPRSEAIEAVAQARAAGIRTVMITGDHPTTAQAIAREMGILRPDEDPTDVVHARATPEDKINIVRAWKKRGAVVAMTGDGVNDAPALREAHIGVAMGKGGTEVTREASDIILTDDNFASIIAAVKEGRGVFDNIKKTLVYLLAGNAGELFVMLGAAVVGLPLPLTALQILWVNLVTDGLPALALVTDPAGADVLTRPPQRPDRQMLGRSEWIQIIVTGVFSAVVVIAVFFWAIEARDLQEARNLAFSVLVFSEVLRSAAARSPDLLFWEVGAFTNMRLLLVLVVSVLVQLGIHHIPFTQELFGIGAISLADCALSFGLGLLPVSALELWKLLRRLRGRRPT